MSIKFYGKRKRIVRFNGKLSHSLSYAAEYSLERNIEKRKLVAVDHGYRCSLRINAFTKTGSLPKVAYTAVLYFALESRA